MNSMLKISVFNLPPLSRKFWITRNISGHGLDVWKTTRAALDIGETGIKNVVILADSAGEGQWAALSSTQILANGFVGLLNSAFSSRWQDTGVGFQTSLSISMAATNWTYSPWTFDTNWTLSIGTYGVGSCCMRAAASGAVASIQFAGTGVVINCTCGWTTGTAHIAIDGVSKNDMNTTYAGVTSQSFEYTGLDNGIHTLTITTASATQVILNGIYPLTMATRGIRTIRNCIAGIGAGLFTGANALYASITQWQPVLTVIALIANDAGAGGSTDNYKTYTQTIITEALKTGSVILYADYPRPDKNVNISDPYLKKLEELSDENDVPLIDCITPLKGKLFSFGCVSADSIHPNAKGHNLALFNPIKSALL